MNLKKKIWKVFTSKFVGTGPSSYEKRIYQGMVSQRLRNTSVEALYTSFTADHLNALLLIMITTAMLLRYCCFSKCVI